MKVAVGDQAPDITVSAHNGQQICLSDYRGEKVVLFFYPKDGTPVCTKEACAFRDTYEQFVEAGAVVIGVSADSEKKHQSFAAKHRLPFLLVSDKDGSLRKGFAVPKTMGFLPGRVTYVIDKEGVVRLVFNDQSLLHSPVCHVEEALKRLKGTGNNIARAGVI
ncbi:MAG: peroxiredoxin [Phycisphaerae bacterium]